MAYTRKPTEQEKIKAPVFVTMADTTMPAMPTKTPTSQRKAYATMSTKTPQPTLLHTLMAEQSNIQERIIAILDGRKEEKELKGRLKVVNVAIKGLVELDPDTPLTAKQKRKSKLEFELPLEDDDELSDEFAIPSNFVEEAPVYAEGAGEFDMPINQPKRKVAPVPQDTDFVQIKFDSIEE